MERSPNQSDPRATRDEHRPGYQKINSGDRKSHDPHPTGTPRDPAAYTRPRDPAARPAGEPPASHNPGSETTEPVSRRPWEKPGEPATMSNMQKGRRDAIDKIVPGPGHTEEVDNQVRERMEEESPDGRPPSLEGRRKSKALFYTALIIVWVVVLSALYWYFGMAMAALALLLTAIYVGFAAWPTWRAALERQADEKRAEREVESENNPGAPPDRQPPSQSR